MPRKQPKNLKEQGKEIKLVSHTKFVVDTCRQQYVCKKCKRAFEISQLLLPKKVMYGEDVLKLSDNPEIVRFRERHRHEKV